MIIENNTYREVNPIMLKRFEVENFKGFKDNIIFDLSARDYAFNGDLVRNGIVNKAIIYGKNGIGKSNLGIALFDLVMHLTDKEKMPPHYLANYINLDSQNDCAYFKYTFQFGQDVVEYSYLKKDSAYLISETILINRKKVLYYNYFDKRNNFIDKSLIQNLKIELLDNKLSVVKYIYRNTPTNPDSPINKMMNFVDKMLWYRGLSDGNAYCGFTNGVAALTEEIYKRGKTDDFQRFLTKNGIDYNLRWAINNGMPELMVDFPSGKNAPFLSLISTGTRSLLLFYYWSIASFESVSFLFIDEFDAFFHYESAETIVLGLNNNKHFQTILTTHNTYLMQNKLTRPDCCFIMTKNKITSLCNSTKKEIREAHNLEKMYVNGAFINDEN